ncbi:MAG: hypothetical protein DI622_20455 [Chryseobacterium sp.]|nr:MAG: hypothetical protein DI622_20455 [Chryseobacterium sp.]
MQIFCRRLPKMTGSTENICGFTSKIQIFARSTKKPKQLILNGKINTEEVTIPLGTMLFSLGQELL